MKNNFKEKIKTRRYGSIIRYKNGEGKGYGFGFIQSDEGEKVLFFHISDVSKGVSPDELKKGVRVGYYKARDRRKKGYIAYDVDTLDKYTKLINGRE